MPTGTSTRSRRATTFVLTKPLNFDDLYHRFAETAELFLYARSPSLDTLDSIWGRIVKVGQGASSAFILVTWIARP